MIEEPDSVGWVFVPRLSGDDDAPEYFKARCLINDCPLCAGLNGPAIFSGSTNSGERHRTICWWYLAARTSLGSRGSASPCRERWALPCSATVGSGCCARCFG